MLELRAVESTFRLESNYIPKVFHKLLENGWTPALWDTRRRLLELAGVLEMIPPNDQVRLFKMPMAMYGPSSGLWGDIFFGDGDLYYLTVGLKVPLPTRLWGKAEANWGDEGPEARVEAGVLSTARDRVADRLRAFTSAVEVAMSAFTTRPLAFDWHQQDTGTSRLERTTAVPEDRGGPSFSRAEVVADELTAANALCSKLARDVLIEFNSRGGFARESDILEHTQEEQRQPAREAIGTLKQVGLLTEEHLLQCRRKGAPLTRLQSPRQIADPEVANLVCPYCGSLFAQETMLEGYSVSELGSRLTRGSRWMTVWVTDCLMRLGIPIGAILWNVSDSSEEVDLLMEFLGQVWMFELKDREFGAGDAYPLSYRKMRYQANQAVIITTGRVNKDAKQVFTEMGRDGTPRQGRRQGWTPIYVEGLDAADNVLRRGIFEAALRYALQKLAFFEEMAGIDLHRVLVARFGEDVRGPSEETA